MRRAIPLIFLLLTALTACGTRGPLTLPPPSAKTTQKPAPTLPASTQTTAPSKDLNTANIPD